MNWDDFKVFIFVAKSNNVTEAGFTESLGIDGVAQDRCAGGLAQYRVFSKTTHGHFLTEAGRALLPLALETEERFKLIERQMSQPGERMAGKGCIDCPELMGTHLIIPGLADSVLKHYNLIGWTKDMAYMPPGLKMWSGCMKGALLVEMVSAVLGGKRD
nr:MULTISPECIES: hypothetical protein [unclassified Pseudomonas]